MAQKPTLGGDVFQKKGTSGEVYTLLQEIHGSACGYVNI